MGQWVRALAAFVQDPGSIPSMLMVALSTVCQSSFRGFDTFLWLLWIPGMRMVHTHTHKIRFKKIKRNYISTPSHEPMSSQCTIGITALWAVPWISWQLRKLVLNDTHHWEASTYSHETFKGFPVCSRGKVSCNLSESQSLLHFCPNKYLKKKKTWWC